MHRISAVHQMHRIAEQVARASSKLARSRSSAAHIRRKELLLADALSKSGVRQLCRIQVTILEGSVTLNGRVDSFYLKQLAQEAVRPSADGMRILNQIEVR